MELANDPGTSQTKLKQNCPRDLPKIWLLGKYNTIGNTYGCKLINQHIKIVILQIKDHIRHIKEITHYNPLRKTEVRIHASLSPLATIKDQKESNGWVTVA